MPITFQTDNLPLQAMHDAALTQLARNIVPVTGYDRPVLVEGAEYPGTWLECGPHEGLVYGMVDPQIALDNHRVFFQSQHEDGYIPCYLTRPEFDWPLPRIGTGWLQTVVPLAATAWEVSALYDDDTFLQDAYTACTRYDAWLARHRDTQGTGLCELFCEFDTGHDNSPRFARGMPRGCPDDDACRCPEWGALPYLAPDLSATIYGGRIALAKMARRLGLEREAAAWDEKAQATRRALLAWCFDAEDGCFYDLDRNGRFVRVRGDALTRVLGEHGPDQALFEAIYARHIKNPEAFWTPFPLPSIAADDPAFVRELPPNSWGGAAQALTALRAPRWMDYYGKHADLRHLMMQWVQALTAADGFRQQMNPWTGEFTPGGAAGYSPAMLVGLEFVSRLHGVRREADHLEWACGLPPGASQSRYTLEWPGNAAMLTQDAAGAALTLNGSPVAQVVGGCCLITRSDGAPQAVIGIQPSPVPVRLALPGQPIQTVTPAPDQRLPISR